MTLEELYERANKNGFKYSYELQLTTDKISLELEEKIEDKILYDVCWNKTEETYISNEKVWNVSYFFEI